MPNLNWSFLVPLGCIIGACGIFWGPHGAGYALFGAGLILGLAHFLR